MPEIRTDIEIQSDAQSVWKLLTDIEGHKTWNTIFKDFKGTAEVGRGIKLKLKVAGKDRPFAAKVLTSDSPKEFAWGSTKSALDLLISARHYFIIEELAENKVRFTHGEKFGGLLPTLFWPLIKGVEPQYHQMNKELKAKAESE